MGKNELKELIAWHLADERDIDLIMEAIEKYASQQDDKWIIGKEVSFHEMIEVLQLSEIKVNIINPIRSGDVYKEGKMIGFKAGKWGAGPNGTNHWIKKPKIQVSYDIFTFGKSNHTDWIDFDNCNFFLPLAPNQIKTEESELEEWREKAIKLCEETLELSHTVFNKLPESKTDN